MGTLTTVHGAGQPVSDSSPMHMGWRRGRWWGCRGGRPGGGDLKMPVGRKGFGDMLKVWVRERECGGMCERCVRFCKYTACWLKLWGGTGWHWVKHPSNPGDSGRTFHSALGFAALLQQHVSAPQGTGSLHQPVGVWGQDGTSSAFWHSGSVPCTVNPAGDRHTSKYLMGNIGSSGTGALYGLDIVSTGIRRRPFEMPLPSPAPQLRYTSWRESNRHSLRRESLWPRPQDARTTWWLLEKQNSDFFFFFLKSNA